MTLAQRRWAHLREIPSSVKKRLDNGDARVCCPFHAVERIERTPSIVATPDGAWTCYTCALSGTWEGKDILRLTAIDPSAVH